MSSTLNIIRTIQPSLSPLPNVTSFGSAGSLYAQLFYDGVEQFYCKADSCLQDLSDGGADWSCQNLACTCISNASFCGGVVISNLTDTINGLTGTLDISCGASDNSTHMATCAFKQSTIASLFGSSGLSLNNCAFGECVRQSVIDSSTGNSTGSSPSGSGGKQLGGGVIAGLAVVGGLILLALVFLLFGFIRQRRARRVPFTQLDANGATVAWADVNYIMPGTRTWLRKKKSSADAFTDDKVILDSVSGRVRPGQMMAILGPSGMR